MSGWTVYCDSFAVLQQGCLACAVCASPVSAFVKHVGVMCLVLLSVGLRSAGRSQDPAEDVSCDPCHVFGCSLFLSVEVLRSLACHVCVASVSVAQHDVVFLSPVLHVYLQLQSGWTPVLAAGTCPTACRCVIKLFGLGSQSMAVQLAACWICTG